MEKKKGGGGGRKRINTNKPHGMNEQLAPDDCCSL